jgi:hypothetical protein
MAKKTSAGGDGGKKKGRPGKDDETMKAVDEAVQTMLSKLQDKELKLSVSDLVRLLQLQKELKADQPRDITVKWVNGWDEPKRAA